MDNIIHFDKLKHIDEISFEKPVKINQIRIARCSIPLHPNVKNHRSNTQADPIKNFEVFYKDLKNPKSRFSYLFQTNLLNEKPQLQDSLIPCETEV